MTKIDSLKAVENTPLVETKWSTSSRFGRGMDQIGRNKSHRYMANIFKTRFRSL